MIIPFLVVGAIILWVYGSPWIPVFLAPVTINVNREGAEEWLPVVKGMESFLPTIINGSAEYYNYNEDLAYRFNVTQGLEYESYWQPGSTKVEYTVKFDVNSNSTINRILLDVVFNNSYWDVYFNESEGRLRSPLSWIYLTENSGNFYHQSITNRSAFQESLKQYIQNFSLELKNGESYLYILQEWQLDYWFNYMGHRTGWGRLVLATTTGRVALIILIYQYHMG